MKFNKALLVVVTTLTALNLYACKVDDESLQRIDSILSILGDYAQESNNTETEEEYSIEWKDEYNFCNIETIKEVKYEDYFNDDITANKSDSDNVGIEIYYNNGNTMTFVKSVNNAVIKVESKGRFSYLYDIDDEIFLYSKGKNYEKMWKEQEHKISTDGTKETLVKNIDSEKSEIRQDDIDKIEKIEETSNNVTLLITYKDKSQTKCYIDLKNNQITRLIHCENNEICDVIIREALDSDFEFPNNLEATEVSNIEFLLEWTKALLMLES